MPQRLRPEAEPEPYGTAKRGGDAMKHKAGTAAAADLALTTHERIRMEYFNRFLCRVFSEGPDSEWVLKGGTALLAVDPGHARHRPLP